MIKNKNNWNTLLQSKESTEIAKLLGVTEAKLLRIGNDTSDEEEMAHMDWNVLQSSHIRTTIIDGREIIIRSFNGELFIREEANDVISYYVINDGISTLSTEGFILLKSVGTSYDEKTGMTYPTAKDNSSDMDNGFHLSEIENGEWWEKLSSDDKKLLPKEFQKLSLNDLKSMEPGVFAQGEIENSEDGLFMTSSNIGKKLLWVAKRGGFHDWAIYTHWADKGFDYVMTQGDKVSKYNVRKLVNCTEDALKMYRS